MVRFTTAHGAAAVAALARGVLVSGATLALVGCAASSWVTTRFADEAPATASTAAAPAADPAATGAAPAQPSRFIAGTGTGTAAAAPAAPMASAAGGGAGMLAAPLAPAALAARGSMTPTEAAAILADIEPAVEPLSAQGNRPYYAFGRRHVPFADERPYTERGAMAVIETRLQGRPTANGETHDMGAKTAAHLTLPLPSYVRVTNVKSGASAIVRVNDRGPARRDRLIELSTAAAERLKLRDGDQVEVVRLLPADIAQIKQRRAVAASVLAPPAAPVAAAMPVPAPAAAAAAQPLPPGRRAVAPAGAPAAAAVAAAAPAVAPAVAPAPAAVAAAAAAPQPMAAAPYPPAVGPVPPGVASGALPSAVPGVAAGAMASGPMPPGSAAPVAAAAATGAAARATAPAAPSDDLRSGRFSVQVATFAVESNAQTLRDRVAGQVKSAGIAAPVRVISRNSRSVVAVGDLPDKASADALADQLRRTLNQDVVVFRR
jgi:rare lipoprotein A